MRGIYESQELEQFLKNSHDVGEGMFIVESENGSITIVNKETGEWRQFTQSKGTLLVDDDEIDYDAMEKDAHTIINQAEKSVFRICGCTIVSKMALPPFTG